MSTREDPEGRPTVLELVPVRLRKALVPVGRLDFLTEGLLLLTDDGDLAQRVAHPRYGCVKTYEVKVRGTPDERKVDRLRRGLPIDGKRTRPARIVARKVPGESENSWWTVELSEGRTRQIREMFQRVGHPVMKLRRVAIGPVRDPDLPPGGLRELTEAEVESLRRVGKKGPGGKAAGRRPKRDKSGWAKAAPKDGGRRKAAGKTDGDGSGGAKPAARKGGAAKGPGGGKASPKSGPKSGPKKGPTGGPRGGSKGPAKGKPWTGGSGPGGKKGAGGRKGTGGAARGPRGRGNR